MSGILFDTNVLLDIATADATEVSKTAFITFGLKFVADIQSARWPTQRRGDRIGVLIKPIGRVTREKLTMAWRLGCVI